MTRRPMRFYVQISLDSNLNFNYADQQSGKDARRLAVIDGDQIVWVLDPAIPERSLQIDFDAVNPFQTPYKLTLRGKDQVISTGVRLPAGYTGNPILKYTVSLGNGLYDDPDIVPVGTEPIMTSLANAPVFSIRWNTTGPPHTALDVTSPSANPHAGSGGTALVIWAWAAGSDLQAAFTLDFTDSNWGDSTRYSTDDGGDTSPFLPLNLPPGQGKFTITTTSDSGNEVSVEGDLTVTA